ncbi:hypothetical protein RHGRI_028984 [Rhododendron griersonianum]|uniref:Uncharacterized protein n=1 Tax=Rhododendron griersonianum TaxID=479676 RepID=A0AAV6IMK7_9ERIC|nr:hypothetical protein RHGRI_028984 [Rhododendron griersonianum]KAG5528238.1 hypothetical protein RHGRI_028984 [Rhododendron griersonianum]KAG5528239.1 hypothetical protein RHGRI_028984 [Rhododendron griersonianum]
MKISQPEKVIRSSDGDVLKMRQPSLGVGGGGEIGQKKVRRVIRCIYPVDDVQLEPVYDYDYSSGEEVVFVDCVHEDSLDNQFHEDSLDWLSEWRRLALLEDEEFEQFVRSAMVVEKGLDEYKRPKLKIVYVDPTGGKEIWVTWLQYKFLDSETDAVEKEEGLCLDRPRLIFVIQDKDFWPGTDSDPEAIERRLVKEEKKVVIYDGDLNPELPGYSFLVDNRPWLKAEEHMFSSTAPKKVKRRCLRSCEPPLDEKELEQVALVENLESSCSLIPPPVDSSCSVFQIAPKKKMKISQPEKVIRSSDGDALKMRQSSLGVGGGGEIGQKKVRRVIRCIYPVDDVQLEPVYDYDYSSGEEVVFVDCVHEDSLDNQFHEDSLDRLSECRRLALLEDEKFEQFVRSAMVVEKGLDEYKRPKLKIVYVDPTDGEEIWVTWLQYKFLDSETDAVEKEEGLSLDRPRLIFVIQDKDFWPGTDSDPEAIERCLVKEEKKVVIYDGDLNPELPGYSFLVDNCPWLKAEEHMFFATAPKKVKRRCLRSCEPPLDEKELEQVARVENLVLSCSLISPPVDSSCSVFQIAPKKKMKISQLEKVIRSSDRDALKMKQPSLGVGGGEIGQKKVRRLIRSFYPFDDVEPVYDYSSGEEVVYEEYAREDSLYWLSECKRLTLLEDGNFEQFVRSAMVVEKELDEYNRPKLKIVYVDPIGGDERWVTLLQYRFLDVETDAVEKEEGLCLDRPRLIFVIQDKDFWPGTDSDPEAIEMRLVKEEKKVIIYNGDLNPELPGYSFLVDNRPWLKAEKHMFSATAPKKKQLKKVKRCFL